MKKITTFLCMLLPLTLLQGCLGGGGGSSSTTATQSAVRLVNASYANPSLDLLVAGTSYASAVASASASNYSTIGAGTSIFSLQATGSGVLAVQTTLGLAANVNYTLVAYTSGQQLRVAPFVDNEAAPAAGDGKIRIANLSTDAGSLDVYVTAVGVDPTTASPLTTSLTGTTSYFEVTKGNYHIWVTGTGDKTDLRLDIPSVTLNDQQILTLALTSTTGGTLVDGLFITQQGAVGAVKNTNARIRLAGNIASNGTISATVNGVSLGSGLRSPVLGSYAIIPSGALTTNIVVNGATVNAGTLTAAAGTDLTLMALGNGAAPQFVLLSDDNTRSTTNSAKLRLVNGVNGLNDSISLYADFSPVALAVAPGTSSTPISVNSGTIARMEVDSSTGTALYVTNNVNLIAPGVYSAFLLGDAASPVGFLRRDR